MISVAQAQQQIVETVVSVEDTERLELQAALGRVNAADIVSSIEVPPCDNSAMDGFAVRVADLTRIPITLPVTQRIPAGSAPMPLQEKSAARIFTGGSMPPGADAVVIQENCSDYNGSARVTINKMASAGNNIRPRGQDIECGAIVARSGERLTAAGLSLIASVGVPQIDVYRQIRVAVFSTGNELVEPGQQLAEGQIYNSNRTALSALCTQLGYQVYDCGIVQDTLDATTQALAEAAQQADVIISSGGVSVGDEDHVKPAVQALGSLDLWKVQMKPGKPVAFGQVAGTPFLGLPGNPVSSYVVFQLLALPLLATLQGETWNPPVAYPVVADFVKKAASREEYIRVQLAQSDGGLLTARPFANASSGVMSSLSWADGLVRQTVDQAIGLGDQVAFLPLTGGML